METSQTAVNRSVTPSGETESLEEPALRVAEIATSEEITPEESSEETAPEPPAVVTAREAVTKLALEALTMARACEAGILEDQDTESLHAYRVNLRRLRSLLASIKEVYPEEKVLGWKAWLGAAARETSRHRDLDVYLLSRKEMTEVLPPPLQRGLKGFFSSVLRERRRVHRRLSTYLQSTEYRWGMGSLEQELTAAHELEETPASAHPIEPLAADRILRRLKQFIRKIDKLKADSPDEDIHEIRIVGKKLRYLLDFFGPLFPGKAIRQLGKELAKLQKKLGRFNDTSVQQAYLLSYAQNQSMPLDPAQALSLGGLITAQHLEHQQLREEVSKALRRFAKENSFRRLRKQLSPSPASPSPIAALPDDDDSSCAD